MPESVGEQYRNEFGKSIASVEAPPSAARSALAGGACNMNAPAPDATRKDRRVQPQELSFVVGILSTELLKNNFGISGIGCG